MVDLVAKSPGAGCAPLSMGGVRFEEAHLGPLTSFAPFKSGADGVARVLKDGLGLGVPQVGRLEQSDKARVIWFGRETYLLIGAEADPALGAHAALTDQSDAWVCGTLSGEAAADVLARLTPLDLRDGSFRVGAVARTEIAHMQGCVVRVSDSDYLLMVFRSMAQTLWHDVQLAMESVSARG